MVPYTRERIRKVKGSVEMNQGSMDDLGPWKRTEVVAGFRPVAIEGQLAKDDILLSVEPYHPDL